MVQYTYDRIMYTLKTSLDTLYSYNTSYILDGISCIAHFGRGDSLGMKSHHKRSWDYLGGPGADLGGGCRGCAPPPEIKFRIYVFTFKNFLAHCQWRHSLEVHPLLRKILDPPLLIEAVCLSSWSSNAFHSRIGEPCQSKDINTTTGLDMSQHANSKITMRQRNRLS